MTAQDVEAAHVRLSNLRSELQDAAERRNSIAGRLKEADLDARAGYQARLAVLDERILSFEREISKVNVQLMNAPAGALIAGTSQDPDPQLFIDRAANDLVPIVAILSVFVFAPFAIALSRFIWKRSSAPARPALADQATQQRLEQLQQAVDTIAIEVERISEGQRFVTRILSDRSLSAGSAEPVRVSKKAAVPNERG